MTRTPDPTSHAFGCAEIGGSLGDEDAARYAELATDFYMARNASYRRHSAIGNQELATAQVQLVAEFCAHHPGFGAWFERMPERMTGEFWRSVRASIADGRDSAFPTS